MRPTAWSSPGLHQCQVATPLPVVRLLWDLINARRSVVDTVVDFGAGDGRFAQFGKYRKYVGYELDEAKIESAELPPNAIFKHACALETSAFFSGAIGNPPFIRNQDLGRLWRRRARELIYQQLGAKIDPFTRLQAHHRFSWDLGSELDLFTGTTWDEFRASTVPPIGGRVNAGGSSCSAAPAASARGRPTRCCRRSNTPR